MSCLGVDDGEAQFTAESEPFTSKSTYGGTQMAFTMSWVDNCEGDSLDVRNPSGKSDKLGDSCWKFMLDNWEQCKLFASLFLGSELTWSFDRQQRGCWWVH